ncbi:MAG: hypothetical protein Q7K57_57240 [Burkholderiaceae bacterium]|nr:hypothetical protein [Burkholderiaceae bacterium]
MSWAVQAAIAALIFAAGGAGGAKWQLGVQARADLAAADVRASDSKQQIKVIDRAAGVHVAALATVNNQLGDAREHIAKLSGRECLGAGTVSVLNAIGDQPVPAAAVDAASAPAALASGGGLRFATDRDTAGAIAICRARYAEVASQVNQILDIEDARHPAAD